MAANNGFGRIWAGLLAQYPMSFKDVSPVILKHTYTQYERLLSDIPIEQLEAAALQCATTCKWFPTVAELREAAFMLANSDELSAEETWGIVRKAISRYGSYQNPVFESERIAQAVEVIGWRNLCMGENEAADRAHFFRIYERLAQRDRTRALMLPEVSDLIRAMAGMKMLKLKVGNSHER